MSFKDIAQPLIKRGVPVIPLLPRTKKAFSNDWPNLATSDPARILQWDSQYPDANIGCVGLAKPGGIWFFEIDDPYLCRRIESEESQKFPKTFRVRSSPGKGHIYFKHTPASLELAARKAYYSLPRPNGQGEFCSARLNHAYVAGPGSIHPDTGLQYQLLSDNPIVEAPEWLISWIKKNLVDTEKLPVTASHEGPKIPRGSHDNELTRIAGRLRGAGMEVDSLTDALIEICEKRCEDYGSDYREMCEKIAHSIGKKPAGDGSIPLVHKNVPSGLVASDIAQAAQARSIAMPVIDDQPALAVEPYPEFPEMSGTLWNLAKEMFPDIPISFKFMSLVTHWGLVRSGLDILAGQRNFQTRFYTCLISEPWRGKTAAMNEAHNYLRAIHPPAMLYADGVDSGPALVDDFEDLRKAHPAADRVMILLHADEMADMFEKAKITAQSRNTLSGTWLSLYESNIAANRARSANKGRRIQIDNAHLAFLGGTTVLGYEQMWQKTGGGTNGLMSRFIPIVTNSAPLSATPKPSECTQESSLLLQQIITLSQKPKQTVYIEGEADKVLNDWWLPYQKGQNPNSTRLLDMVKRMILVLAVTNPNDDDLLGDENHITVSPDVVRQSCAFGDYILKIRDRLNPTDSFSAVQAFENGIIRIFDERPNEPITESKMQDMLNVRKKPGGIGAFAQALKNCLMHTDVIVQVGMTRKGKPVYKKAV